MELKIGSLFSGIGGLELGLERAGLGRTVWQVEQSAYCRQVLARHWPDAVRHTDVRMVGSHNLEAVDVICGGFPCQDLSSMGAKKGLFEGPKSSLWWEMLRVIHEVKPTFVVIENIYGRWRAWLPFVRRALWGEQYTSLPVRLRASDVGARHFRARCFLIAYRFDSVRPKFGVGEQCQTCVEDEILNVANIDRQRRQRIVSQRGFRAPFQGMDTNGIGSCSPVAWRGAQNTQSMLVRRVYGVSDRVDRRQIERERKERIKALGNSVVPQCAEVVGRVMLKAFELKK